MAKMFSEINEDLKLFIEKQKMFFVGTAAEQGRVNVSPKGMDSFRVLSPNKVLWLNLTGSGNETAAHLLKNSRMTIMFCSFEGKPLILRLYGNAIMFQRGSSDYEGMKSLFEDIPGARQIVEMEVKSVQTSCGFAVPFMDFQEERSLLSSWAQKKEKGKIEKYWEEKNVKSIDGFDTGIVL